MRRTLLALFLTTAVLALLPACVGQKHKDDVLFPSIALAWPGVQDDLELGIETGPLSAEEKAALSSRVEALDGAIDQRSVKGTRAGWLGVTGESLPLRPWAERGIQARIDSGEVTSGVASSLTERVERFDAAVVALPLQ